MNTSELLSKFQENFEKELPTPSDYTLKNYELHIEIYPNCPGKLSEVIPSIILDAVYKAKTLTSDRVFSYASINSKRKIYIAVHVMPKS